MAKQRRKPVRRRDRKGAFGSSRRKPCPYCREKIDQVAAFQNFAIVPLTFLSGGFYSIHTLPPFWQHLSRANPFFYMVDGFRYGFFGASDFPPLASLAIVFASLLAISSATLLLLRSGYKLRH